MPAMTPWVSPLPESPRGDENIVRIVRVAPDVGHAVDGFKDLTAPAPRNLIAARKTDARPFFQSIERGGKVTMLAGLVILTADQKDVVVVITPRAHVVIGIAVLIPQTASYPTAKRAANFQRIVNAEHTGCVGRLFRVDKRSDC
jgi:hypothetical protein